MVKVKLLLASSLFDEDYNQGDIILRQVVSDWEEVSEEDLKFLRANLWRIKSNHNGYQYVLVVDENLSILEKINNIKLTIQKECEKQEKQLAKEREEKRKKSKISATKRLEKAKAKIAELEALVQKENSNEQT